MKLAVDLFFLNLFEGRFEKMNRVIQLEDI